MKPFLAFLAGLFFSIGLIISQMIDPGKVLAFLTLNANWDPSLIFVMGAGVAVMWIANLVRRSNMKSPIFDHDFSIPAGNIIDQRLILGAIMFGLGWGLIGLCPAPVLVALAGFKWQVWLFFFATCVGIALFRGLVAKDLFGINRSL